MDTLIQIISHTSEPSESVERLQKAMGGAKMVSFHYGKGVNKLKQYEFFRDEQIPHPPWTTQAEVAKEWLSNGFPVICRALVKGQKGHGLSIISGGDPLPEDAKIFTKYLKKKREFRVNLFQHKVVNIREKLLKSGEVAPKYFICSPDKYVTTFVKNIISNENLLKDLARRASFVSDSDFIGIDIGYNSFYDEYFVLEVNSGPSIEGSSIDDFVQAMKKAANV